MPNRSQKSSIFLTFSAVKNYIPINNILITKRVFTLFLYHRKTEDSSKNIKKTSIHRDQIALYYEKVVDTCSFILSYEHARVQQVSHIRNRGCSNSVSSDAKVEHTYLTGETT